MAGERILLLNTSIDVVEALTDIFEREQYVVTAKYVRDLRQGRLEGAALLDEVKPRAAIIDIAPPVDENWRWFMGFRPLCKARAIPFILTTTIETQVRELAGRDVIELLLKPFDMQLLLDVLEVAVGRKRDEALAAKWFPQT